jgi:hypothetical protein
MHPRRDLVIKESFPRVTGLIYGQNRVKEQSPPEADVVSGGWV